MTKIIVYVRGGNVQDVIADQHDVEVMIVDYDNEACSSPKTRSFEPAHSEPNHFHRTVAGIELN